LQDLRINVGQIRSRFPGLRALLAAASPARSGDDLAGIAAASAEERVAARMIFADPPLSRVLDDQVVLCEDDEVTRLIIDTHDTAAFTPLASKTVGEMREWLLHESMSGDEIARAAPGITTEMAAAISKLMRNQDLVAAARKIRVVTRFRKTLGLVRRSSVRLQPTTRATIRRALPPRSSTGC
jgi:ethanolamine ammonia-lyase large subunit